MSETILLKEIAHARSGDKGNHANVGVIAYTEEGYRYLSSQLTEQKVLDHFRELGSTQVERFELPGIRAYNFLIHNALAGGGSQSLRLDSQGKTLGLAMLQLELDRPEKLDEMKRSV